MSIEVHNLLKRYGQQTAVDQVSFNVGKGEIVGFLGPNGAGKSTTMKMITGYLKPDAGTAVVCGINVAENAIAAKKQIGYLPEANPLYYDMYVKEYLAFIAGMHGLKDVSKKTAAVITLTGLQVESKKKIVELSKGYKQRVGLAAALIHEPEVLILDEPTSGLDPNQIIEIRNVIKQQGKLKTVLFSSHILQEVEAICDRVVIINRGKMVANDTLANLQRQGTGDVVKVTFREKIEKQQLASLPAVQTVLQLNDFNWQLTASDVGEVKRQVLEFSLHNQLNIVALVSAGGSLEDIFRNLTNTN